jgi:hypothetical protein
MREGVASRTAQIVAAYRLTCPRLPSDYGDPEADDRLAADVGAGGESGPGPRMAGYLRFRTAFFDRFVVNGIERGATQVAVIGAGYDGREHGHRCRRLDVGVLRVERAAAVCAGGPALGGGHSGPRHVEAAAAGLRTARPAPQPNATGWSRPSRPDL